MSFRGQPQRLDEIVAWVQEQLRSIQSPMAGGTFVGPKGDKGETGAAGVDGAPGATGPPGPSDPNNDTWRWSVVAP